MERGRFLAVGAAVLGVLLLAAGFVAATIGPAAAGTAANPPTVEPITATFAKPVTTYRVEVTGASGTLHYSWKNSNDCGTFTWSDTPGVTTSTAAWSHPDSSDPANPGHDFQPGACPNEAVHPGAITVTVSDDHYKCVAGYSGSAPGTAPEGGLCVAEERPTTTAKTTTTTRTTTTVSLIPHIVNPVEDPTHLYKRVMGELSKENLKIAKEGGLFSFIPYFKDGIKLTQGLKEKDTFVEVMLGKVGLTKVGLGTAAFKKGFAVISIVGDVSAITFNLGALYQGWQAADPPRFDYRVLASPQSVRVTLPPSVTADAPKPVADAGNALLANGAELTSVSAALLTTFERIQGAYRAKNAKAEAQQAALGAKLADREAALLGAQPVLAANLVAASRSVGQPFTVPASLAATASAGRTTIAPDVRALLLQLKLTPKALAQGQKQLLGPVSGSFVFPDFLASPENAAKSKQGAQRLHAFAAFLRTIANS